jgi:hypothetical protein
VTAHNAQTGVASALTVRFVIADMILIGGFFSHRLALSAATQRCKCMIDRDEVGMRCSSPDRNVPAQK